MPRYGAATANNFLEMMGNKADFVSPRKYAGQDVKAAIESAGITVGTTGSGSSGSSGSSSKGSSSSKSSSSGSSSSSSSSGSSSSATTAK
jgi:hypothetical protein